MSASIQAEARFSRADAYRHPIVTSCKRHRSPAFAYSERHLKCVWFDDSLRPALLRTDQGEKVTVEHPGNWNLSAGPDFRNATLRVNGQRRLTGDVEIHIRPTDWNQHGHARDPAYAQVIAHVTYFPGQLPRGVLPPQSLQIALRDPLAANPCFSFDNLDLTAYPYAQRSLPTPCAHVLSHWSSDALADMLESAGADRLRRKAERFASAIENKNADQLLYEELMSAFGYKNNRAPFRLLAERLPLTTLREESGQNVIAAYALFLGVAGLLPTLTDVRWDPETRNFIRKLWNHWWKLQARWRHCALKDNDWSLGGQRPQNHPRRRLMAAALLFTRKTLPAKQLLVFQPGQPATWLKQILAWLQPNATTYWQSRLTLGGRRQASAIALIGPRRAAAIISNVILPFLATQGSASLSIALLRSLPLEEDNSIVRQTAHQLLGPDQNPRLYRTGLRRQGLIQIFYDFCLDNPTHCSSCALLKKLKSLSS